MCLACNCYCSPCLYNIWYVKEIKTPFLFVQKRFLYCFWFTPDSVYFAKAAGEERRQMSFCPLRCIPPTGIRASSVQIMDEFSNHPPSISAPLMQALHHPHQSHTFYSAISKKALSKRAWDLDHLDTNHSKTFLIAKKIYFIKSLLRHMYLIKSKEKAAEGESFPTCKWI